MTTLNRIIFLVALCFMTHHGEQPQAAETINYPEGKRVELEPIGPRERLKPGESASFTEEWWLLPYEFPAPETQIDLQDLSKLVETATTLR